MKGYYLLLFISTTILFLSRKNLINKDNKKSMVFSIISIILTILFFFIYLFIDEYHV